MTSLALRIADMTMTREALTLVLAAVSLVHHVLTLTTAHLLTTESRLFHIR